MTTEEGNVNESGNTNRQAEFCDCFCAEGTLPKLELRNLNLGFGGVLSMKVNF